MEMKAERSSGRERKSMEEKKQVIFSMREGRVKRERRERKSVGWEREVGQKESCWREGGILSLVYSDLLLLLHAGCPIPPADTITTNREEAEREWDLLLHIS